jgi:hypothetical protein
VALRVSAAISVASVGNESVNDLVFAGVTTTADRDGGAPA